jgi:hypothetical protein
MPTATHTERKAAEELLTQYCRTAHLGELQTEIVRQHLCAGRTPPELRETLPTKPGAKPLGTRQIRDLLDAGLRRVCGLPGAREMLQQTVTAEQFERITDRESLPPTVGELMDGPRRPEPGRRFYGREWTTMCFLPGQETKKGERGVPVRLVEEIRRPW